MSNRRFKGVLSPPEMAALIVLAVGSMILLSILLNVMSAGPVVLTPSPSNMSTATVGRAGSH